MLLVISTAYRVQTLAAIELNNIHTNDRGIEIKITKLLKTSGPGKFQPYLVLPRFEERPDLCVASYLHAYIHATHNLRGDHQQLFMSTRKPHRPISTQTLSHWIKKTLQTSGVDTTVFTAHSTRHAATSAVFCKGVSVDLVRRTAGWSQGSQIFAKFYQRPIFEDRYALASSIFPTARPQNDQ